MPAGLAKLQFTSMTDYRIRVLFKTNYNLFTTSQSLLQITEFAR